MTDDFEFSDEEYKDYLFAERRGYVWALVNYGNFSQETAEQMALNFYRLEPRNENELAFHDMAWHWAMLKIFGSNYWIDRPDLLNPPFDYAQHRDHP